MKRLLILSGGRGRENSLGNAGLENLGMGYLISHARSLGWEAEGIDLAFSPMANEDLVECQLINRYDVIGVSCMTWSAPETIEIAQTLRAADPDLILTVGGAGATSMPEYFLPYYDYVVTGEGEQALEQILASPERKQSGMIIRGQRNLNWDGSIYPWRDKAMLESGKLHMRGTWPMSREKQRPASIAGSRGCPNACGFCMSEAMWQRRVVFRAPSDVVDEIEYLESEGYNCFDFADLNLNLRPTWLMEICQEVIKRRLNREIMMGGLWNPAIDQGIDELIPACSEAGFVMLSIGWENPDPAIRTEMRKQKMSTDACHRAFELCLKHGITSRCLIIIGSPGQDEGNIAWTKSELANIKAPEVRCSDHAIFPNTRDWEQYSHLLLASAKGNWPIFDTGHQILESPLGDVEAARIDLLRSFYNSQAYRDNRTELIGKRPAFEIGYKQLEGGFLRQYGLIEPGNCLV